MSVETIINSNGSGYIGTIEELFERLETCTLDRSFEAYGNFVDRAPVNMQGEPLLPEGWVSFFGNFFDYSHVFNVETNDPDLIRRLSAAILKNKRRPEYRAQPRPTKKRAATTNA